MLHRSVGYSAPTSLKSASSERWCRLAAMQASRPPRTAPKGCSGQRTARFRHQEDETAFTALGQIWFMRRGHANLLCIQSLGCSALSPLLRPRQTIRRRPAAEIRARRHTEKIPLIRLNWAQSNLRLTAFLSLSLVSYSVQLDNRTIAEGMRCLYRRSGFDSLSQTSASRSIVC